MNNAIVVAPEAAAYARQALATWYLHAGRFFPWRADSNPYHILLAEMMLRRTQARQVVPVYQHFVVQYPDALSLDQAPEEAVIALLRPLGLSWRAANFKALARALVRDHSGQVPRASAALLMLPGVGPYVAEAVRCFAFHEPAVVVDTNTVRVAARYFGFEYNPESRRRPEVIEAVAALLDPLNPAHSGYALLDFAALICRARNPDHAGCPLREYCAYRMQLPHLRQAESVTPGSLPVSEVSTFPVAPGMEEHT